MNGEDLLALSTVADVSLQCKECFTQNFYFLLKISAFSSIKISIHWGFFFDTMFSWP